MVGPTTTELESFKELIQFDHEYFKPQPQGKIDLNGQIRSVSSVVNKLNGNSIQSLLANGKNNLKNVKIFITSDAKDIRSQEENMQINNMLNNQQPVVELNANNEYETVNISDLDDDMLTDLNFDLLDDLENILNSDLEGQSCPVGNDLQSQESDNGLKKGTKRKATEAEIDAIVDTLTYKSPSPAKSATLSVDSDYISDGAPSPYSASSVYSPQGPVSPQDEVDGMSSPLGNTEWEESFTELFPDLL